MTDTIQAGVNCMQNPKSADDHSGVTREDVIKYLREEACRDVGEGYNSAKVTGLLRNASDYLDETKEKPVVELIDRHELLRHIVNRHSECVKGAESQDGSVSKGICIGEVMAFEELHKWVKDFVQH